MTDEELKHISIRGVNADIYEQFSNKVKDLDLNIGQALSKMMEDVIKDFDETFPDLSSQSLATIAGLKKSTIQHQNRLIVTKKDLLDADRRFFFQHIRKLYFAPDVDKETFEKYVIGIQHCNKVRIPDILPKLQILSMINHCSDVDTYTEEAELDQNGEN